MKRCCSGSQPSNGCIFKSSTDLAVQERSWGLRFSSWNGKERGPSHTHSCNKVFTSHCPNQSLACHAKCAGSRRLSQCHNCNMLLFFRLTATHSKAWSQNQQPVQMPQDQVTAVRKKNERGSDEKVLPWLSAIK